MLIGVFAWLCLPVVAEWYWSGVDLKGQFKALEEVLGQKYVHKANKVGFFLMIGCFVSAYKVYKRDRKKL